MVVLKRGFMSEASFGAKHTISPLIATVLLLVFSVAVGAVVMSWGEEYVAQKAEFVQGVRESLSSCEAVSFTVVSLRGVLQSCVRGNSFELTVDNGADVVLYDLHARLVGANGVFTDESLMNAPLERLHAAKFSVKLQSIGDVAQVKLVPKIKVGEDIIFCKDQSVVLENVRTC